VTIRETAFPLAGTIVGDDLASEGDGCERLLSSEGLPEDLDRRGRQRMAELAPRLSEIVPATRIRPVRLPMPGGWSLRDPSIAVDPRGFRMIVESSNWSQGGWKAREIHGANGIARTRLFLVELKPDFEVRRIQTIADSSNGSRPARGVADRLVGGRLVVHRGDWWLLAVARPAAGDQERLLLGRLEGSRLKETIALSGDTGPDIWAPVSGEESGSLDFLTSVVPTEVRRFDRETRDMAVVARKPAPPIARQLTIGTQGIPFDGGFLCLLHEAVQGTDGVSRIVHRWVWFDHEWTLSQLSRPFTLREAGMERASGLTRAGDELIVSFGDDDREVWTATLAVADVGALLAPPLAIDPPVVARQRGGPPTVVPAPELAGRRGGSRVEGTDGLSLVSMTMTGSNRDIIGDALRSVVDWVDLCLLIDTGIEDDTIEVARAVVGDKLIVRQYPWHNDFSAARNFSLAAAAETGADWAVTVDSDERIITGDADIRSTLITATEPAFMAPHATGDYTKDRFFRLPVRGEFRGPTHEAFYRVDQFGGATLGIPASSSMSCASPRSDSGRRTSATSLSSGNTSPWIRRSHAGSSTWGTRFTDLAASRKRSRHGAPAPLCAGGRKRPRGHFTGRRGASTTLAGSRRRSMPVPRASRGMPGSGISPGLRRTFR
jgi:hypothetical protein